MPRWCRNFSLIAGDGWNGDLGGPEAYRLDLGTWKSTGNHGVFQFSPSNIEKVWEKPWEAMKTPFFGGEKIVHHSWLVGWASCTFSDLSHPMWPRASQGLNEGGRVLCAQPSAILVGSQAPRGCHLSKSLLEVSRTQWCGRSCRLHNFQVNVRQFSTITQSCLQTEHSYTMLYIFSSIVNFWWCPWYEPNIFPSNLIITYHHIVFVPRGKAANYRRNGSPKPQRSQSSGTFFYGPQKIPIRSSNVAFWDIPPKKRICFWRNSSRLFHIAMFDDRLFFRRGPQGPMVVLEQSIVHCEATFIAQLEWYPLRRS